MERLTEYWNGQYIADIYEDEANESGYFPLSNHKVQNLVNKLAEYEDKQEQGLLLELPVAIDTEVWRIVEHSGGGRIPVWYDKYKTDFSLYMLTEWGITVFLTEAEAEVALTKMGR